MFIYLNSTEQQYQQSKVHRDLHILCGKTNSGSKNKINYKTQWTHENLKKHRHDDRLNCVNSVGRSTIPGDK